MLKSLADNIKNIRIEDLVKLFMQYPKFINSQNNVSILPSMIENSEHVKNSEFAILTEKYILSIHSTKERSRSRNMQIHHDNNNFITMKYELTQLKKILDNKQDLHIKSVSFSGGGYNCMYHVGVIKYIFENSLLFKDTIYLGASGGAGIAALVLCYEHDHNRFNILQYLLDFVINMKNRNLKLHDQIEEYSNLIINLITEDRFDLYIKNTNRCHISVTNISNIIPKNEIKSFFSSYKQFTDTLRASACIPILLDNKIRTIDNKQYLDGGLSNNIPIIDSNTIRISCIYYPLLNADIFPKHTRDITHCFIPPDRSYIISMYDQGYDDILTLLIDKKEAFTVKYEDDKLNTLISDFINDPDF